MIGRAIWALAAGQTLGYACLYYVFAAFGRGAGARPGLGRAAPWRRADPGDRDRRGAGAGGGPAGGSRVVAGIAGRGAGLGALALGLLAAGEAQAHAIYLAAWALIGLSQAASLYEVCSAFLVRRLGAGGAGGDRAGDIGGGLCLDLAFPAGALGCPRPWGWRGAVWAAAAVMAGGTPAAQKWWSAGPPGPRPLKKK